MRGDGWRWGCGCGCGTETTRLVWVVTRPMPILIAQTSRKTAVTVSDISFDLIISQIYFILFTWGDHAYTPC